DRPRRVPPAAPASPWLGPGRGRRPGGLRGDDRHGDVPRPPEPQGDLAPDRDLVGPRLARSPAGRDRARARAGVGPGLAVARNRDVTSSRRSTERQRAIVTGGAGFIGSHLVDALRGDGWAVLVVDDLSTGRADRLPPDTRLEVRDIATDDLTSIVREWRPRALFHLAAQSSVPASEEDPLRDLAVNVVGTIRVAEAAA